MAKSRIELKTLILFVFVLLCPISAEGLPPIEIHFVDVGQGDAILIKVPTEGNILIDTGSLSRGYKVEKYLKDHCVKQLKALIITHFHQDHVGGLFSLLPELRVEKIYDNGIILWGNNFYEEYVMYVRELGLQQGVLRAGNSLSFGDLTLEILSPSDPLFYDLNADSIAIKLVYGKTSFLMAADLTEKGEKRLLDKGLDLKSDVLKVGHHGALDATSEPFLEKVSPRIVVVSVGKDNRFGYPAQEIIDRLRGKGVRLLRTDVDGTIVIKTNGEQIAIMTGLVNN